MSAVTFIPPGSIAQTDDLTVLRTGHDLCQVNGHPVSQVELLWYHNLERENGQEYELYRVIAPLMLRYLPQESRADPAYLDKMRTVLTGLFNQRRANFDVLQILAGMWDPDPLGVMQIYAVSAWDTDLDQARHKARLGKAALTGVLAAAFEQIVLEPLALKHIMWLMNAFARMRHVSVVVGQPDERMNVKGMGREGPGEVQSANSAEPAVTGQQLEMFLRAMAKEQREFVAPLIASRIPAPDLASMLAGMADEASVIASLQTGSESVSASIALPISLSANLGQAVGTAFGRNRGVAYGQSRTQSQSRVHTLGSAYTEGHAVTDGTAHTTGFSSSQGTTVMRTTGISTGVAHTAGTAHTDGVTHTEGATHTVGSASTQGSFSSQSASAGFSGGTSLSHGSSSQLSTGGGSSHGATVGNGTTDTQGASSGRTNTHMDTRGDNLGVNVGGSVGGSVTAGGGVVPVGVTGSASVHTGVSRGWNQSQSDAQATTEGQINSQAVSGSQGLNASKSENWGASQGVSHGGGSSSGWSYGSSSASGASQSHTSSVSNSVSHSNGVSQADTESQSASRSRGMTIATAIGHTSSATSSTADTASHSETFSTSHTRSTSDATGTSQGQGASLTLSDGLSLGRSMAMMQGMGMGMGAIPSFGISRGYMWTDDQAIQLTALQRAREETLRQATLAGAYQTDFYILTDTEMAAATAEVAVRQAFQGGGPLVVTPVQTRTLTPEEQDYIRLHAMAFTPSTRLEPLRSTYEPYRDSTMLLPQQLAAYMAPALFEEGFATTVQERVPAFGFYPDMQGDVVWAHQFSTETGQLTDTQLRMSREVFFHTAFTADTGFGKTVAAERMVYETTKAWHTQTIVLDFGAGWRELLNAPGLAGHVEVWQLQPGGVVPFRWNPWQVGRRIRPELQMPSTCEIFKNAGRMGERQLGYMRRAASRMWREAGVLTFSEETLQDAKWGYVQPDEWAVLQTVWAEQGLAARPKSGRSSLKNLSPWEKQALAVHRSKRTGIPRWVAILREMLKGHLVRDPNTGKTKRVDAMKSGSTDYASLDGLLLRLEAFIGGEMLNMYGPGPDTVAVEELGLLGPVGGDRWGISILEGGSDMDEYTKSVIMGLVAWHLYNDGVVRRRERINAGNDARITQIVFEEANKVLTGVASSDDQSGNGAGTTLALFQNMWRNGRKNDTYLHAIAQTPSDLPAAIISSSNSLCIGQLKNASDRDIAQAALGWSEKGFTDEDYKRYISRMIKTYAIVKLGYTDDPIYTAPVLCRPIMLKVREPTDQEIYRAHQALRGTTP